MTTGTGSRVHGWVAAALGVALLCASNSAAAAMSCTIVNTSGVSFGNYDTQRTAPLDSTGMISFRCSQVAGADSVMIQLGRGDAGVFLPRAMLVRSHRLEYNLYLDAARTRVWGDGTGGTSAYVARPDEGVTTSVPIYGRIPPRQNVKPETYTDTIVVTLLY
jgi:spore coat protein U-like protein